MSRILPLAGIVLLLAAAPTRAADIVRERTEPPPAPRAVVAWDRESLRSSLGRTDSVVVERLGRTNLAGFEVPADARVSLRTVRDPSWHARWRDALAADDVTLAGGPCPLAAPADSLPPVVIEFRWGDRRAHGFVRVDFGTCRASVWETGRIADCLAIGPHARELLALVRDALPEDRESAPATGVADPRPSRTRDSRFGDPAADEPARAERRPRLGEYVDVDELPQPLEKVPPEYPDVAREAGIEGQVMVEALVLVDGTVGDVQVMRSIPALDAAAVASVRRWRFLPGKAHGRPVAVWVGVPVPFRLH